MQKKARTKLISGAVLTVIMALMTLIFLLSIRGEFVKYLKITYPQQSFKVGFAEVNIIYGRFEAAVTSQDDGTTFGISREFNAALISEDYPLRSSARQYNSRIKKIFSGSDLEKEITDVSGGGKEPFANNSAYDQIDIYLASDADQIATARKALELLKEKGIVVEKVIFMYEQDGGINELSLSLNDRNLADKEIAAMVEKIK